MTIETVKLYIGTDFHDSKLDLENVPYVPKNGCLLFEKEHSQKLVMIGSMHGMVSYLPGRHSHIVPAFLVKNNREHEAVVGLLECRAKSRVFFRKMKWLAQQDQQIQVPAADCVERYIRSQVMTLENWGNISATGRLLQFERALNELELLEYCVSKHELDLGEKADAEAIWWDSMKLIFPDNTSLEINSDGPFSVHTESHATTQHISGPPGKREAIENIWIANTLYAGTA